MSAARHTFHAPFLNDHPSDGDEFAPIYMDDTGEAELVGSLCHDGKHRPVLDIDFPCYVIPSTTPGHFHLYLDPPDGMPWPAYEVLLEALARCGIIEKGFALASIDRAVSTVRLPWVHKSTPPTYDDEAPF